MSEICKHKSIKNGPYKSNNGSWINFTGCGKTLSLSYHFKCFCISIIIKQCWKLIVSFSINISWFGDGDEVFCQSYELFFHLNWDISLNYCKILRTSWLSCYLQCVFRYLR